MYKTSRNRLKNQQFVLHCTEIPSEETNKYLNIAGNVKKSRYSSFSLKNMVPDKIDYRKKFLNKLNATVSLNYNQSQNYCLYLS